MSDKSKSIFDTYFKSAKIIYSLKSNNLNLPTISVNNTNYNELQIIEVLITTKKIQYLDLLSFARDIVQGISYPTILVLKHGQKHYRFFSFIIHKGKFDSFKSIVDKEKATDWIWYDKSHLHNYDNAVLHNMFYYFYKSKNIYDIMSNLLNLFDKHFQASVNHKKALRRDYYFNGHKYIADFLDTLDSYDSDTNEIFEKYSQNIEKDEY